MEKSQELIDVENQIVQEWLDACGTHVAQKNRYEYPIIQQAYEELVEINNDPEIVEKATRREIHFIELELLQFGASLNEISEKYSLDLSDIKKIEKAMKIEAF